MNNPDLILCIMPKVLPDAPTVGAPLLKTYVQTAGFTCEVIDFNIKLYNEIVKHGDESCYLENDYAFQFNMSLDCNDPDLPISDSFDEFYKKYRYVINNWVEILKQKNPKYIGLSLFSMYSVNISLKLSQLIKKEIPTAKIIWGGAGVGKWCDILVKYDIISYYVWGDGENALVEILKGNVNYPGINGNEQVQFSDLNNLLVPNYDDINWNEYTNDHSAISGNVVYVTGSRGCVKKCTFCNIPNHWPKYIYRSSESIVNEIWSLGQTYNRNYFKFTDSLINGGMKIFHNLLKALTVFRKDKNKDIKWASQFIMRSKLQMPEEVFQLLKDSGCDWLEIGIESFSENVRNHMNKKFSDADMWWCLEMLQKYKIRHALLMIVGYPTETDEDHAKTLEAIKELHRRGYLNALDDDGRYILQLIFTNTMMLWNDVPIWHIIKDEVTNYHPDDHYVWDYRGNTFEVRAKRFSEIHDLVNQLQNRKLSWFEQRHKDVIQEKSNKLKMNNVASK